MERNNNLLSEDNIKNIILEALYSNGLISKEIYEKCGKPKIISSFPHDLRTNDVDKLQERLDAINREYDYLSDRYYNSIPQMKEGYRNSIKRDTDTLIEHRDFNNNLNDSINIDDLNFEGLPEKFNDDLKKLQDNYISLKNEWDNNIKSEVDNFIKDSSYEFNSSKLEKFDKDCYELSNLGINIFKDYGKSNKDINKLLSRSNIERVNSFISNITKGNQQITTLTREEKTILTNLQALVDERKLTQDKLRDAKKNQ